MQSADLADLPMPSPSMSRTMLPRLSRQRTSLMQNRGASHTSSPACTWKVRFGLVVRASDCQCLRCNIRGFNPTSGIWRAAILLFQLHSADTHSGPDTDDTDDRGFFFLEDWACSLFTSLFDDTPPLKDHRKTVKLRLKIHKNENFMAPILHFVLFDC